jgi:signal transduction histidine kinase
MATPANIDPPVERLLALLQKALGHELPNQLLAIQGLTRVLDMEEGERLGAEGKDFLARLAAAAQRTHELIRMLADLVRAARAGLPEQPTGLAAAIAQAVMAVKQLSAVGPIEYDLPEGDLFIWMSGVALHKVLVELLRHARRAIPADREARIRIGGRAIPDGVEFWVADNGSGLSDEQRQRLFEPFAGRTGADPGTGLELILVRQLVESCGGALRVESVPEQGNRFIVSVPARVPAAPVQREYS